MFFFWGGVSCSSIFPSLASSLPHFLHPSISILLPLFSPSFPLSNDQLPFTMSLSPLEAYSLPFPPPPSTSLLPSILRSFKSSLPLFTFPFNIFLLFLPHPVSLFPYSLATIKYFLHTVLGSPSCIFPSYLSPNLPLSLPLVLCGPPSRPLSQILNLPSKLFSSHPQNIFPS